MSVITIRIDKEVKRRMRAIKGVNWSQVVREAILKRIEIEERKEVVRRINELTRLVKPVSQGELVRWVREDRGR